MKKSIDLRSTFALLPILALAGCATHEDDISIPVQQRYEIVAAFATPADAQVAIAALERMDDGSLVLTADGEGKSVEALVTESAESWLLANFELVIMYQPVKEPSADEKNWPSCDGHCGEWMEVCGCDDWCILFGDCCPSYWDVCY